MISGIVTAILITLFLATAGWAYGSGRRERFAAAERLPLVEDGRRVP